MCLPSETDLCKYQHEPESPQIDGERTRQVGAEGRRVVEMTRSYKLQQRAAFFFKKKKKAFFILVRT